MKNRMVIVSPQDSPSRVLARTLQKQVDEARYLTAENANRYRPIMRYFYEQHMGHQYTLSGDDVLQHMRVMIDSSYTEDQCEQDLRQLAEWGNLIAEQDRSRARTVEEFLRRKLRYQITPYGIAFERLLRELEEARGSGGSLDVGLLELLYANLVELGDLLNGRGAPQTANHEASGEGDRNHHRPEVNRAGFPESTLRRIWNLWSQAFDSFDKVGRQASDYLGALNRSRHEDFADVEAFLAYKDVLLQYLNSFVTGLFDFGDRIRAILTSWTRHRVEKALLSALISYETRYVPGSDGRLPSEPAVRDHRRREWLKLHRWFEPRGGLEALRRTTTATIERVVRQSQRLMQRRSGLSRRRELEQLAIAFAHCSSLDEAHRLAGAALGCITPRHIMGSAEVFMLEPAGSVWREETQDVDLQPVRRGGARRRSRSTPVPRDDGQRQAVLQQEFARRQAETAVWDALFAAGEVNLGRLKVEDPALRARLLHVLARCLASPDRKTVAPDGSQISLHLPQTAQPGELQGPDGTLALPQFILKRRTRAWGDEIALPIGRRIGASPDQVGLSSN